MAQSNRPNFVSLAVVRDEVNDGDLLLFRRCSLDLDRRTRQAFARGQGGMVGRRFVLPRGPRVVRRPGRDVRQPGAKFPGRIDLYRTNPTDRWPEYDRARRDQHEIRPFHFSRPRPRSFCQWTIRLRLRRPYYDHCATRTGLQSTHPSTTSLPPRSRASSQSSTNPLRNPSPTIPGKTTEVLGQTTTRPGPMSSNSPSLYSTPRRQVPRT